MGVWNYDSGLDLFLFREEVSEGWLEFTKRRTRFIAKTWWVPQLGWLGISKKGVPNIEKAAIWGERRWVGFYGKESKNRMGCMGFEWGDIWAWQRDERRFPQPEPIPISRVRKVSYSVRRTHWRKVPWWRPFWHISHLVTLRCWDPVAKKKVIIDFYMFTAGDGTAKLAFHYGKGVVWYTEDSVLWCRPTRPGWYMWPHRWYHIEFDPKPAFKTLVKRDAVARMWGIDYDRLQLVMVSGPMELHNAEGEIHVSYFEVLT